MTQVKCYGCGGQYDAANETESFQHTHHLGDSGLSREKLLEMVNELQAERDEALRGAANPLATTVTANGETLVIRSQ